MSAGLPLFLRKALTLAFTYCIIKTLNLMKGKLHDVCCHDEQTEQIAKAVEQLESLRLFLCCLFVQIIVQ
jgi:hypothetical protein